MPRAAAVKLKGGPIDDRKILARIGGLTRKGDRRRGTAELAALASAVAPAKQPCDAGGTLTNRPDGFINFSMPPLPKERPRGRTPNAERTDRSRRAILDAAVPIFAERGYAASLNEIIRASGLTKGGFYFHFPSKAALALAVIDDYQRRWAEQVMAEAARHVRAVDRLFSVPRILGRLARQGEGPAGLLRLIDDLGRDPKLRDQVCGSLRVWIRQTAEQFREAQREGAIRRDVNADLLAEVAVGGFVGMQTMTEQLGDDDLERRIEALIEVIGRMALVQPKNGRRSQ